MGLGWEERRMVDCDERRDRVSDNVVKGVWETRAMREEIAAWGGGGGGKDERRDWLCETISKVVVGGRAEGWDIEWDEVGGVEGGEARDIVVILLMLMLLCRGCRRRSMVMHEYCGNKDGLSHAWDFHIEVLAHYVICSSVLVQIRHRVYMYVP